MWLDISGVLCWFRLCWSGWWLSSDILCCLYWSIRLCCCLVVVCIVEFCGWYCYSCIVCNRFCCSSCDRWLDMFCYCWDWCMYWFMILVMVLYLVDRYVFCCCNRCIMICWLCNSVSMCIWCCWLFVCCVWMLFWFWVNGLVW